MNKSSDHVSRELSALDTYTQFDRILTITLESFGIVGNLLMFVVYYRGSLRRLSISVYFRWISIYSTIQILCLIIVEPYWTKFVFKSVASLKIAFYLKSTISPTAVWFEVAASLDRFLTILFPIKFRFLQKRWVKSVVVATVFAYNMIFYSYLLFEVNLPSKLGIKANQRLKNLIYTLNLINMTIVPFVLMLSLSIATFIGVLRAHQRIKSLSRRNNMSARRKITRDVKFGVTMIFLNFLFLICVGLSTLNNSIGINPFSPSVNLAAHIICSILLDNIFFYYFTITFYVHLAVNNLVRKELWTLMEDLLPILKRINPTNLSRSST